MDKGDICKDIISTVKNIFDVWGIISFLLGLGSGGGVVVSVLNHIPMYYPILLGVIAIVLIIWGIIRTLTRNKRWESARNDPTLLNILKTLQEMHEKLGELSIPLYNRRVSTQAIIKASVHFRKLIDITDDEFQRLAEQDPNEIVRLLFKRLQSFYKFNLNDFSRYCQGDCVKFPSIKLRRDGRL